MASGDHVTSVSHIPHSRGDIVCWRDISLFQWAVTGAVRQVEHCGTLVIPRVLINTKILMGAFKIPSKLVDMTETME